MAKHFASAHDEHTAAGRTDAGRPEAAPAGEKDREVAGGADGAEAVTEAGAATPAAATEPGAAAPAGEEQAPSSAPEPAHLSVDEIFREEMASAARARAEARAEARAAAMDTSPLPQAPAGPEAADADAGEPTVLLGPEEGDTLPLAEAGYPGSPTPPSPDDSLGGAPEGAAMPVDQPLYASDTPSPYLGDRKARMSTEEIRRRHHKARVAAFVAILVALVAGGAALGYGYLHGGGSEAVEQFNTTKIQRGEFLDLVTSTVALEPVRHDSIGPQVTGTIDQVRVSEGDAVEEGDVLFTLKNQTVTDTADKAKSTLDAAKQTASDRQKDLDDANKALDDVKKSATDAQGKIETLLSLDSGTMSHLKDAQDALKKAQDAGDTDQETLKSLQKDVDDTQAKVTAAIAKLSAIRQVEYAGYSSALNTAYSQVEADQKIVDAAQSSLDDANKAVSTAQAAYDSAQAQLDKLNVRATISGTVHSLDASLAQGTEVTTATHLCDVDDASSLVVEVPVPADKAGQVKEGQEVRVTFDGIDDLDVTTTVDSLSSATGALTAHATITDPDERLSQGAAATASVVLQEMDDVLMVPKEAVVTDDDGKSCLDVLLDPSRAIVTRVDVDVKATNDTTAVVEAPDIQADTSVVLPGQGQAQG
ncbi:MAG: efflux RND transporter periplasmic adaptor subunit [Olsenella sp.]|jgi:HlyD family secretion protein